MDFENHKNFKLSAQADFYCLYADNDLLVLNKPAGLLAVPGRGADKADALSARVQQYFPEARIVHRLDMATSGLMLMARTQAMHAALGRLFETRQVFKMYVAKVVGPRDDLAYLKQNHIFCETNTLDKEFLLQEIKKENPESIYTISAPIMADWPNRPRQKIDLEHGKAAQTLFFIQYLEDFPEIQNWICARLSLIPITGRTHQLRLHLSHIGWPIMGDTLYAPPHIQNVSVRLLLHAQYLAFIHPFSGQKMQFTCDAPF